MDQCTGNPILKTIRVILSLVVIGIGITTHNWLGFIGIFTLISAFTGSCPLRINISKK